VQIEDPLAIVGSEVHGSRPGSFPVLAHSHYRLHPGNLQLERSCFLVAEYESSGNPGSGVSNHPREHHTHNLAYWGGSLNPLNVVAFSA
jgi:hypothetical protein